MSKNKVILIIFFIILVFGYLFVFSEKDNTKAGKVLILGRAYDAISLDPPNQWDGASSSVINNIYENLVQFVEGSSSIEACLATSWSISEDKLEYTFNLRQGVYFQDGTLFNADSVIFNFERQINKNHQFRLGSCECFESNFSILDSVKKVDDYKVVFKLKKPYTPFIELLAMSPLAIASPTAIKKFGNEFYKNPCGTGPFKLEKWIPNELIILIRNDNYWGVKPKLERIVFKVIPDNKLRLKQLYAGIINVMDGINPEDIESIMRNSELKLLMEPAMNIGYIAMNTEKYPFNKREVRLAINYAINKKDIVNYFYQNTAIVANGPMPPNILGYNHQIAGYPYDINEAKRLLKLVNLENGFKTKLFVLPITTMAFFEPDKIANAIIANLKDIGIIVEKYTCNWAEYQQKVMNGEHEMAMYVWSADIPDPDNFLYVLLDSDNTTKGTAQNIAFYKNDILHYTLMKAQTTLDVDERLELYKKAQEIIFDDAPWVPLVHSNQIVAIQKKVKNFKLSPVTFDCYKNIDIDD